MKISHLLFSIIYILMFVGFIFQIFKVKLVNVDIMKADYCYRYTKT